MLNAQEILEKKFEKSAFGYRSDEVDDYLQELSAAFDKLQNEKIQMERKLEVLAEKIEEYRADEDSMRAAILDARKLGSSIVKDAQRQADEIIADANAQSAKVIDSIQMRAEREKMNLSHLQKEVATFKNLTSMEDIDNFIERVGFPVLVRPSYVLSGAAMNVCSNEDELKRFLQLGGQFPQACALVKKSREELPVPLVQAP